MTEPRALVDHATPAGADGVRAAPTSPDVTPPVPPDVGVPPAVDAAPSGLLALTRLLNDRTPPLALAFDAAPGEAAPVYPHMAVLPYFRQTWAALRLDGQMRRSLEYVPENAGPLNSRSLVHRALSLMQETAPGYLQHLLAYVDALDNLGAVTAPAPVGGAPSSSTAAGPTRKSTKNPTKSPAKSAPRRAGSR